MQKLIVLSLAVALVCPACSMVKGWYGSPVKNAAVEQMCKDGLSSLDQVDAQLKLVVTDQQKLAQLQKLHDFAKLALEQCIQTMAQS